MPFRVTATELGEVAAAWNETLEARRSRAGGGGVPPPPPPPPPHVDATTVMPGHRLGPPRR